MRRFGGAWLVVFALSTFVAGGCMSSGGSGPGSGGFAGSSGPGGPNMMAGANPHYGSKLPPPSVPGVMGPHGQNVPMVAPYNMAPPGNPWAARQMMAHSIPMNMVQFNNPGPMMAGPGGAMMPSPMMPGGGIMSPAGMNLAPLAPGSNPFQQAKFTPDAGNFGVVNANIPPGAMPSGGVIPAQAMAGPMARMTGAGMAAPGPGGMGFPAQRTQVRFTRPSGMKISWFTKGPDGKPAFSTTPIETPGRYNFLQAAVYRLKLSNIEGRPGLEIYPTMEVVPSNTKTEAFLSHSSVPVEFTNEDFKQIADGNYVVKVIYLPDPQFQDVAGSGTDEILSTRLEPGADPIQEALRRGSILLVIRMGNVDQEAPNTPPLSAPGAAGPPMMVPGIPPMPGAGMPLPQVPFIPGVPAHPHGVMAPHMPMPPGGMPPGNMPPGFGSVPGLPPGPNVQTPRPVAPSPNVSAPAPGSPFLVPSEPLTGPTAPIPVAPDRKGPDKADVPVGPTTPLFPDAGPSLVPAAPSVPSPAAPTPNIPGPNLPGINPGLPSTPPPLPGPGPSKLLDFPMGTGPANPSAAPPSAPPPALAPGATPPGATPPPLPPLPPLPSPAFPPAPGTSGQPTSTPTTTSSGNGSLGLTSPRMPTPADLAIQTPVKGR